MKKITFSKYCASGFYGEKKCRCKRCCEKFDKFYNELDEKRDWIYSRVMSGESFIVENAKIIDFNSKSINFNKKINLFYTAKEDTKEKKLVSKYIDFKYIEKLKDYFVEELIGLNYVKKTTFEDFEKSIKNKENNNYFIKSNLSSHLNTEAITYVEFKNNKFVLATTVMDLNMNIIDVWTDNSSRKKRILFEDFEIKFLDLNYSISEIYIKC